MKRKLYSSGNYLLDQWIGRATVLQLQNDALEAENLKLRQLAFTIWCRDFERLKESLNHLNQPKGDSERHVNQALRKATPPGH